TATARARPGRRGRSGRRSARRAERRASAAATRPRGTGPRRDRRRGVRRAARDRRRGRVGVRRHRRRSTGRGGCGVRGARGRPRPTRPGRRLYARWNAEHRPARLPRHPHTPQRLRRAYSAPALGPHPAHRLRRSRVTVERRTTWPQAAELQQAADTLRDAAPDITGRLAGLADPVADWLEATANALAWLAPFRERVPGYPLWETATAVARRSNGSHPPPWPVLPPPPPRGGGPPEGPTVNIEAILTGLLSVAHTPDQAAH